MRKTSHFIGSKKAPSIPFKLMNPMQLLSLPSVKKTLVTTYAKSKWQGSFSSQYTKVFSENVQVSAPRIISF